MYTEINKCRICGNDSLVELLDLGQMTLTGVFPKERTEIITKGPVQIVKCKETSESCGLVQMKHSYDSNEMYGENYGYRSGLNQSMVKHLQMLVERIGNIVSFEKDDLIIDIGSNDSTLLRSYPDFGQVFVGIDPTGTKFQKYYPESITLIPNFFSADMVRKQFGNKKAKVVTSIAMFYDLESPTDFVKDIASILSIDGIWVFEQSYIISMLEMKAYDTICHEHIEYYAFKQIQWMMEKTGLKVVDVQLNGSNGGSFVVTAALKDSTLKPNADAIEFLENLEREKGINEIFPFIEFRQEVEKQRVELTSFLKKLKQENKLVIGYGASTKGNVLLQYCNITPNELPYIAEVNPDKFGSYTPGTLIPIISEEEANKMNPDYKLILPWHFKDTFLQREKAFLTSGGKLVFPLPSLEVISKS